MKIFPKYLFAKKVTYFVFFFLLFISCHKQDLAVFNHSENISISEIIKYRDWYVKTYTDVPIIQIEKAQKAFIKGEFFVRVPLEGSKGMIYFNKADHLKAMFIRTNTKSGGLADNFNGNMEFLDISNPNNYHVVTFKNSKADSIYNIDLTKSSTNSNVIAHATMSTARSMSSDWSFWGFLGCLLRFGWYKWSYETNQYECFGIGGAANSDGSGDGNSYSGDQNDPSTSPYVPIFIGNIIITDPNNPVWKGDFGLLNPNATNNSSYATEYSSNIDDNDPDIIWWNENNTNTVYPLQTLPTWVNI